MTVTLEQVEQPDQLVPAAYSKKLLFGGTVGRVWLWFVAGCLAVTLIPMLFGWRPYVIQSGSMMPRIKVGDIVIASPNHDPAQLLGHVTVFHDPDFPDRMKTHRVVQIAKDGRLVTKGDANPTVDSQRVRLDRVQGLGRLMVRYAGLPLVWAHTGKWLYLFLFGLSLYLSAIIVARDREAYEYDDDAPDATDDSDDEQADDEESGPDDPGSGSVIPQVRQHLDATFVLGIDRRKLKRATRKLAFRSTALLGLALILALPTARAAFASITKNNNDSWSVPNWNYTTEAVGLGPYIYYKLDQVSGPTATDSSGNGLNGTYSGGDSYGAIGALTSESPNVGVTQTNTSSCIFTPATATRAIPGPATYSEIVWFKATSGYSIGGKLVGFETSRTGLSDSTSNGQYDRHVYMDGNGRLWFGVWITSSSTAKTISTAAQYDDGAWHMMVATMGGAGMHLYVDGVQQASDPNTVSETFLNPGNWRFGCGNLSGWGAAANWSGPNAPTTQANVSFQGSLDEVAIYNSQLTAAQIAFLYWIR